MSGLAQPCPLCGERRATMWRVSLSEDGIPHRWALCDACELCFRVEDEATADGYPADYAAHLTAPPHAGRYGLWRDRLKRQVLADHKGYPWPGSRTAAGRWLTRALLPLAGQVPCWRAGGRLLDVGCGGGTYLRAMRALGWEVFGVEPDAEAAARARAAGGATVWQLPVEQVDLPPNAFQVVTMWHVLEHLRRPLEALTRLRRTLARRGSLLLLEVPNFAGPGCRFFAERWFHLDAPRHALALTPKTLRRLLHDAGFDSIRIDPTGNAEGIVGSLRHCWPHRHWLWSPPARGLAWGGTATLARLGWGECLRASAVPAP